MPGARRVSAAGQPAQAILESRTESRSEIAAPDSAGRATRPDRRPRAARSDVIADPEGEREPALRVAAPSAGRTFHDRVELDEAVDRRDQFGGAPAPGLRREAAGPELALDPHGERRGRERFRDRHSVEEL